MKKLSDTSNQVIFEMKDCGGCRTCELVCGFHHTGVFNPKASSLRVISRTDENPGYFIRIQLFDSGEIFGCDGCADLSIPLCVDYCHQDEELLDMIRRTMKVKSTIIIDDCKIIKT